MAGDGEVVVTYCDFRNDDATAELADQVAIFCDPAARNCANAMSRGREQGLTDASFDIREAPTVGPGKFLGDYMRAASASGDVHPTFGTPDGAEQASIFTRRITLSAAVAAARP